MFSNLTQLVPPTILDLNGNHFGGQVPLSSLKLEQFISLSLGANDFVGKIPDLSEINSTQSPLSWPLEVLDLSYNLLNESIPSWIYSLPSLKRLWLGVNRLTGPIKEFHSKSFVYLDLRYNHLHGQIPNSVFQQNNLEWLYLYDNNLHGAVELGKFSMMKSLQRLDLSDNNFTVCSNNISSNNPFPQLHHLGLSSCNITSFPYFLSSLKSLESLDLSNNHIHGTIPEWLWTQEIASSLYRLKISHNFLTHVEQIPSSIKNLYSLDLGFNMIQGNLPAVPPSIGYFFTSSNLLSGEIPSTYCNLSVLEIFDVSNNSIHGKIPSCLGQNSYISVLDLQRNNFDGEIHGDLFGNLMESRSDQS